MDKNLNIEEIAALAHDFRQDLERRKSSLAPGDFDWYPYGTLHNFTLFRSLLNGENRKLFRLLGDEPFADIGAADGDTSFFLEHCGFSGDVIDYGPTNYNGCRGVRLLKSALGSSVGIREVDLDTGEWKPAIRYGLAFFLGILYHLKNPFLVLESLARCSRYALVSTRVTRYNVALGARPRAGLNLVRADLRTIPAAYLVAADETNNDATNFWMFSEAGLQRVLDRAGFDILEFMTVGNTQTSDPATSEGDERAFALVRSRQCSHR